MWRFWPWLPGWGGMTVFDRTWVTVLETVIEALEAGLRSTGQEPVAIEATL